MNKEKITLLAFSTLVVLFVGLRFGGDPEPVAADFSEEESEAWLSRSSGVRPPLFLQKVTDVSGRSLFADFEVWQLPDLPPLPLPPPPVSRRPAPQPVLPGGIAFPQPQEIKGGAP